ncbi:MAG TPA: hypothetical protein PLA85_07920 [Micropepsaceae bacterium]|nr:hypothetical protein [Micropepsaceae bacterium]
MRILPLIAAAVTVMGASPAAADVVLPPSAQFAPGQVWEYNTRSEDSGSTLIVCHVETLNGETIVHVFVRGVTLSLGGESRETDIAHLPMSEAALAASVTAQSGTVDQLPPFQAGYNTWRAENGGVFTEPVAQVIAAMDGAIMPPPDFLNPDPGATQ